MDGPGGNTCTCNEGWTGDGRYCYPGSECGDHQHCHAHATCRTDPSHNTVSDGGILYCIISIS